MLKTVEEYSKDHRYDINPTKSSCLVYNQSTKTPAKSLILNESEIPTASATTHLGIQREVKGKVQIEEKLNLGRRTAYSLLGAGLHGKTGLKQDVKAAIWTIYVVPRMLYGLEVLPYKLGDTQKLDTFQNKTLKQIQHLPERTACVAAEALLGIMPLSAQVHMNTLNLYYHCIQNSETLIHEIAQRQLAMKSLSDASFFSRSRRLLLQYDLPDAYSLLKDPPNKERWKDMLCSAVHDSITRQWQQEIEEKTSLKYINPAAVSVGKSHHIYTTVRPNVQDARRAEIKAKLLTGTYVLQSNRAVFNQYQVDPTCKLCNRQPETRVHFLATCPCGEDIRKKYKNLLQDALEGSRCYKTQVVLERAEYFTQLLLDCTHPEICGTLQPSEEEVQKVELLSREFIQKLHLRRCKALEKT